MICAIDGTLIVIRKPWHNPSDYMTRKRPKPLMNVMVFIQDFLEKKQYQYITFEFILHVLLSFAKQFCHH